MEGRTFHHAGRGRARRDVPSRLRHGLRVAAPPRRRVRRLAAVTRAVSRRPDDRGSARAPVGNRLERRGYRVGRQARRPRRHRSPDRSQRAADPRQPARRRVRDRDAATTTRRASRRPPRLRRPARPPPRVPVPARRHDRSAARRTRAHGSAPRSSPRVVAGADLVLLASLPASPARRGAWKLRWPGASASLSTNGCSRPASSSRNPRSGVAGRSDLRRSLRARHRPPLLARRGQGTRSSCASGRPTRSRSSSCRRGDFAAIEPMTATIDALGRRSTPMVAPGDRFRAWFTIAAPGAAGCRRVTLRLGGTCRCRRRCVHRLSPRRSVRPRRALLVGAQTRRPRGHEGAGPRGTGRCSPPMASATSCASPTMSPLRPRALHRYRDQVARPRERRSAERARARTGTSVRGRGRCRLAHRARHRRGRALRRRAGPDRNGARRRARPAGPRARSRDRVSRTRRLGLGASPAGPKARGKPEVVRSAG